MVLSPCPPFGMWCAAPVSPRVLLPRHTRTKCFFLQRPVPQIWLQPEMTRKIRCSDVWLFPARVPLSRLLGVRPDSLRTHHLFLSLLTCVCQFPFHMKELSFESPRLTPSPLWCAAVMFSGSRGCQIDEGTRGSRRGPGRWHCAHSEGLGRPLELVRRALVIRFPFLCMSQSIHPT